MGSPPARSLIFISHATPDDSAVNDLADAFASAGIETWVDHRKGVIAGDRFNRAIQAAVNDCTAGLFVISAASIKSDYCEAEWTRLLQLGKRLYTVLLEAVPMRDIPLPLSPISWVNFTRDRAAALHDLINAIQLQRDLDPAAPTSGKAIPITGNLPRQHLDLPLIGRDTDLQAVRASLTSNRLTLVRGLGGVGKTRLAVEIAVTSLDQFPDGVIWHEIDDLATVDKLTLQIRDHLRLPVTTEDDAIWQQVHSRAILLILDNAESCKQPQAYARRLNRLDKDSGTRVLFTSRIALRDFQHVHDHDLHAPTPDAALQILLEMAKHDPPKFPLNDHAPAIAQAARYHPRLLEYAVKWAKKFPAERVLETLNTLKGRNAQDALDDMINKTKDQVREQPNGEAAVTALRRLSVCRGGFSYDAASALLDDVEDIDLLLDWGLVSIIGIRYEIDPLVIAAVGEDESARQPHFDFYKALARTHDKKQDYAGLDVESANLEAAFEWKLSAGDAEAAYWFNNACHYFLGNRGRFAQRMDWLTRVAALLSADTEESLYAAVQVSLGIVYSNHPIGNRRANLHRAIAAYTDALRFHTPDAAPLDYAMTQNNLGNAYGDLAGLEDRAANLQRAIAAYARALRFRTPDAAPLAYATTETNLGNVYRNLAALEDHVANLHRAIAAYTEALRFRTPEAAPLDYATTQNNLGAAYRNLAALEDRAANLHRAIAAYTEALRFYTPEAAPLAYAGTQNNLGNADADLAALEDRAANLHRAIAAYTEALRFRTPEAAPLDYAMTQNNLGTAYRYLSELEDRAANLRRAIAAYTDVLRFYTPEAAPLYFCYAQGNLGLVYQDLGDLPQAITCWREAARVAGDYGDAALAAEYTTWADEAQATLDAGDT